jgi:hypothetical protein
MDVLRAAIQTSNFNPVASIAHIQHAHFVRHTYKSVFPEDFIEKFITVPHIVQSYEKFISLGQK